MVRRRRGARRPLLGGRHPAGAHPGARRQEHRELRLDFHQSQGRAVHYHAVPCQYHPRPQLRPGGERGRRRGPHGQGRCGRRGAFFHAQGLAQEGCQEARPAAVRHLPGPVARRHGRAVSRHP